MKRFERLDELRKLSRETYEDQQFQKYSLRILTGRMRVRDVPEKWRRNCHVALGIYKTAFRVARGTSLERFEEELNSLGVELLLMKMDSSVEPELVKHMQRLYEEKRTELERWNQVPPFNCLHKVTIHR